MHRYRRANYKIWLRRRHVQTQCGRGAWRSLRKGGGTTRVREDRRRTHRANRNGDARVLGHEAESPVNGCVEINAASMAWGARNLISTQVDDRGRQAHTGTEPHVEARLYGLR